MSHIFISYSKQDIDFARYLRGLMEHEGFDVWMDESELVPSEAWWPTIEQSILSCVAFVVIMSPNSKSSKWVERELLVAEGKANKPIFPILLAGEPWSRLAEKQYADMTTGLESTLSTYLVIGLKKASATPATPEEPADRPTKNPQQAVSRRFEAAMPGQTRSGTTTEVWVKISLPDSKGLRGELPAVVRLGDLIAQEDVHSSTFPFEFPINASTGKPTAARLCVEVTSQDYDVVAKIGHNRICEAHQVEVELHPDHDSRTVIFELRPKPGSTASGLSRVVVSLYYQGNIVAQTATSTDIVEAVGAKTLPVWNLAALPLYVFAPPGASPEAALQMPRLSATDEQPRTRVAPARSQSARSRSNKLIPIIGSIAVIILAGVITVPLLTNNQTSHTSQTTTAVVAIAKATETADAIALQTQAFTPPSTTATQTPTRTVVPTVIANKQWKPIMQLIDGVEMVLVPPGCFTMGSDSGTDDQKPTTKICFDKPLWIDRYEVTNGQFVKFAGQAGHESIWTGILRPHEQINWFEARDFCVKRGARLPTEAEWEYAARGPDNLVFPWGNDFSGDNVTYSNNSNNQTADVGSKPDGISWVGAYDLSGNVSEWVSTIYQSYPYSATDGRERSNDAISQRVIRGSAWLTDFAVFLRGVYRSSGNPFDVGSGVGFRCARDQ